MKILRCDRCGKEKHIKGIVGGDYDHYGYKTLSQKYSANGIVDVCGGCYELLIQMDDERKGRAKCEDKTALRRMMDVFSFGQFAE